MRPGATASMEDYRTLGRVGGPLPTPTPPVSYTHLDVYKRQPIGGPTIGWVIRVSSPRVGLAVGAVTCFVAAGVGTLARRRFIARGVVVPSDMASFDKAIGGPLIGEVAGRGAEGIGADGR